MLMGILQQVGANPAQTLQQKPSAEPNMPQGPAQPNSSVAALIQQHGVKLINPTGHDPRLQLGQDLRQPVSEPPHAQQSRPAMETPQLAGDGGMEMSSQMMSLLHKLTG